MKKRQSQRLLQENDPSASHPLSQTEDNSDLPPDQSVEPIVQESLLDTRQVVLQESVFRGFLHLAWICMIIGCAGVLAKNIRVTGQLIGFNFYHALTTDLRKLS